MENEALMDAELKTRLISLYGSGDRHYHGLAHIEALLALAAQYRALLADAGAVEAAIWFHDAIYDSRAKDNEARSADLARESLLGQANSGRIDQIAAMIERVMLDGSMGAGGDAGLNAEAAARELMVALCERSACIAGYAGYAAAGAGGAP